MLSALLILLNQKGGSKDFANDAIKLSMNYSYMVLNYNCNYVIINKIKDKLNIKK